MEQIDNVFIKKASNLIGDTMTGLSTSEIVEICSSYAYEFGVKIPHSQIPLVNVPNKRTALKQNLEAFSGAQQFRIISDLCGHTKLKDIDVIKKLNIDLFTRYPKFNELPTELESEIIDTTKHWLSGYPDSLKLYEQAIIKHSARAYERNLIDDLRLSLELLIKAILNNGKSLENQLQDLGTYIRSKGGSKEYINMFVKLIEYYSKYNNTYIKHEDEVNSNEIEFIIELTSCFMRQIVRLSI